MTTISQIEVKCPVCENEFEINVIMSTNSFGSPDLDLRPPEMQRSTMNMWVHECPGCGYVSGNFSNDAGVEREYIQCEFYRTCEGMNFTNPLSERFYRRYLIESEDLEKFFLLLYCVWACDDANDSDNATAIRKMCIDILENLDLDESMELQRADLLRRTRQFARLIEEYENKTYSQDIYNQVIDFHIRKAHEKDDSCYTVEDATKN